MFTSEQKAKIKSILTDFNHFYGYTDAERRISGKPNRTGFFSCKRGEVEKDRINGYQAINKSTLAGIDMLGQKTAISHHNGRDCNIVRKLLVEKPEFTYYDKISVKEIDKSPKMR